MRTRVSTSTLESPHPAARANSSADVQNVRPVGDIRLIARQTIWMSLRLSFVWFSMMKCLSRSSSQ